MQPRLGKIHYPPMSDTAELFPAAKIAAALKVSDAKVKKAIAAIGLKPAAKKGVCNLYAKADVPRIKKALPSS
jgi:hypothetical protein